MTVGWRDARVHGCAFAAVMGVALLCAACGGGTSTSGMSSSAGGTEGSMSASSPPTSRVVIGTANSPDGPYLTGAGGQALYLWAGDRNGKSNCSGNCASQWPPMITKQT